MRALLVVWTLLVVASGHVADAAVRPVVVIPGVEGSKLCDQADHIVWGDRASLTPGRISALRLPFDGATPGNGLHSCGLIEAVSIIPLFWESNIYAPLLATLHNLGYGDSDILIFDYDWRLSNFDNAKRLRDFIDQKVPDKSAQVDIVAHSMGGIVARIYVQTLGGDQRVDNMVLLGTPSRGSAKIFERLKEGFDDWPNALSGGLPEIQRTILSFPSTYELLPTYPNCCGWSAKIDPVHATYMDILDPANWARFTRWVPSEYRSGKGFDFLSQSLATARRLKALLAQQAIFKNQSANSRVHYVANAFRETWSHVFFNPKDGDIVGGTTDDGDGTVLLFSATNTTNLVQFSQREHEAVFDGPEPAMAIKLALAGVTLHAGEVPVPQRLIDAGYHSFDVTDASVNLKPRALPPGALVTVTLTLKGPPDLQRATLTNVTASLMRDTAVIETKPMADGPHGADTRVLQQKFDAPAQPGAYAIRLNVPGIAPDETIFAVMEP
jgi:pimeloyl-ACP methyl ester carboxylesterase